MVCVNREELVPCSYTLKNRNKTMITALLSLPRTAQIMTVFNVWLTLFSEKALGEELCVDKISIINYLVYVNGLKPKPCTQINPYSSILRTHV